MEENLSDEEREKLQQENEIRKIKLMLEKGAKFIQNDDMPALPPELENEFLNYIESFEAMNDQSSMITVFDKIGKPVYKLVSDVKADELSEEIDRLLAILYEKGMNVSSNYEVENREFYRFITEDFFQFEVYDFIPMEGVVAEFFYEGFYPNIEEDLKKDIEDFFELLFTKTDPQVLYNMYPYLSKEDQSWFAEFSNAYERFSFISIAFEKIDIDKEAAETQIDFEIEFEAYLAGILTPHYFKGSSSAKLISKDNIWQICHLSIPKPI